MYSSGEGVCQTHDPDTLKNNVSSMLAWVEVSRPLSLPCLLHLAFSMEGRIQVACPLAGT